MLDKLQVTRLIQFDIILANCQWGAWSIGDCSKSCGGGTRAKYRRKVEHEANGGTCHGVWDIEEDCNTQKCPGIQS